GKEVPPGTVGELVVSGVPGVTLMKGYFKNEQATAETLRDGWLHSGDQAYVDDDGCFFFVDRKKDMIKRAGENVSASEVEETLKQHPAVFDAAVVAMPDPVRDHAIKAYVILKEGAPATARPPQGGPPRPRRSAHRMVRGATLLLQGAGGCRISRRLPPDLRGQDPEAS